MKSLVVTLETAKKLKAAGFPHDTYCAWQPNETLAFSANTYDYADVWGSKRWLAAPTAQEIADQLPARYALNGKMKQLKIRKTDNGWRVGYYKRTENDYIQVTASTLVEALALLWLEVQETK